MKKDQKPYSILVIEDNPGDFAIVEDLLKELISVPLIVHADNFNQASSILSAPGSFFDVILLDLTLTDKSGQELISEMLAVAYLCPVIVLTGYGDIDFSIKSISQGILDYLLKDDLNAAMLYKSIIYAIERKKTVAELTKHINTIEDQNRKLREIAWVQSHVIRAPLARMMLLIDLIKEDPLADDKSELLNDVMISAAELDTIVRGIADKVAN